MHRNQDGAISLLILVALIVLLGFFAVTYFAPFRDGMLAALFPKNSSFAAYLFTEDFENGINVSTTDKTKWYKWWEEGAQNQPKTATLTLEPEAALNGGNGIHIKHVTDVNGFVHDEARLDRTFDPIDNIYVRFRLKLLSDFSGRANRYIFGLSDTSAGYGSGASIRLNTPTDTSKNRLGVYVGGGVKDIGVNLAPNTPYCVEMYLKRDAVNGQLKIWLDGAENPIYELSGGTGSSPISWLRFGSDGGDNTVPNGGVLADYYLDDLAVNTTNRLGCGPLPESFGPERSDPQPVNSLPTGTTSVTMSLKTDVAATCKYSSTVGLEYDAIPNTFSTTGGTTHSQIIDGITPNNNYTYLVRCQDAQTGKQNPDDFPITFRMGINELLTKDISLVPTYQSISVYAPYGQDENANTQAILEWRKAGDQAWKKGMVMTDDRRPIVTGESRSYPNPYQYTRRASILGLQSNTDYEVRVSYQDPDGISGDSIKTAAIKTRNDNFTLGNGKQYFISTTGNDVSPVTDPQAGTINKPFRTIQFAVNLAQAGDSILVRGGNYSEAVYVYQKNGTENNRITIKNYNNEVVNLNGQNTLKNAFVVHQSSFIVISGFVIKDYADTSSLAFQGGGGSIRIHTSKNIVVDGNDISGYIWHGIRTQNSSIITIQNNKINRTRDLDAATGNGHGIAIWDNDPLVVNEGQFVIRNNNLIDSSGIFPTTSRYWDTIGGGSNFEIEGFVSRDSDIYRNSITGCTDDGIEADGGLTNVRIYENYIWSDGKCWSAISSAPTIVGPLYIFRNLFDGDFAYMFKEGQASTGNKYYYNNTSYNPAPNPKGNNHSMSNPGHANTTTRNNIMQAGRYVIEYTNAKVEETMTHSFDYDSLFTTGAGYFVKWANPSVDEKLTTFSAFQQYSGQEAHGLSINNANEFIDLANKNFRLKENSQLKDRGEVVLGFNDPDSAWPYAGSAPDIGAYEIGTSYGPTLVATPTVPDDAGSPAGSPVVSPAAIEIPGDVDGNGKVDIFDYNALLSDFGKTQTGLLSDLDKNGKVDIFDYNLLLTNFGR